MQITKSCWLTILLSLSALHLVHSQDSVTEATIDDRNPAIHYSGGWSPISASGPDTSYNGTVMLTRVAGATATYKFNGTRISVLGTLGPPTNDITISSYTIDSSSPSQYTVPSDLKGYQYKQEFYSSPPLPEGEHTLIITNLKDHGWYWLDHIQVTSPVGALPPTSTSSEKTSDPTPTPTAGSTQQGKAGIPKGVIAGIALAGSALIVLLLLAVLLWKRRQLKSIGGDSTVDIHPPERSMRGPAPLEPYRVEQFASSSNITTSRNSLNEKRTYNGVAPIRSTENSSLANSHAPDGATTQYTSELREDASEIPRSEPSMSRPVSLSKLRPPYQGAPSSRSTGNPPATLVFQMPPGISTPSSRISSSNRRSTDGGVRISGGLPPMTRGEELGETIDTATLPPAYGTY